MKTKNSSRCMPALFAGLLLMLSTCPIFGQNNNQNSATNAASGPMAQVNIYFTAAPAYGSTGFNAFQVGLISSLENTNHPSVPLILSGQTTSVTNSFVFYPGNVGGEILAGVHIHSFGTNTFSLNKINWITSSPDWAFTNVYSGLSFGTGSGVIGANGNIIYNSGSADNVLLTDLWITPGLYSWIINQGQSIDQGIAAFASVYSPTFPITLTAVLNSNSYSGVIILQSSPELYMSVTNHTTTLSWTYSSTTWPFNLEQSTNMITWSLVTNTPSSVNGVKSVTLTNGPSNHCFRLKYQP